MAIRSFSELRRILDFEDRFEYLSIGAEVGCQTFGSRRVLNQQFYHSSEWRRARRDVIARDLGCDLGIEDRPISGRQSIYIHHMNPLTEEDILEGTPNLLDPEFLISVSHRTHNAIHFGDRSQLLRMPVERRPGDTRLW